MLFHCKTHIYISFATIAALSALSGSAYASDPSGPGKPRIALLGDSMTWIGGDSCSNASGWSHSLKASGLADDIEVYARSGATWTNTRSTRRNPDHYTEVLHDDNVVYNQAIRLIERCDSTGSNPDLIILYAGANDAWFASRRPGIFDTPDYTRKTPADKPSTQTTLAGSVRLTSEMLETRFPDATLLFVAPIQMSKTDAATIHKVADTIEATAGEMGWTTLRPDKETCINHVQEAKSPTYTSDGVHTNRDGATILGEYIITHLPLDQLSNATTTQLKN